MSGKEGQHGKRPTDPGNGSSPSFKKAKFAWQIKGQRSRETPLDTSDTIEKELSQCSEPQPQLTLEDVGSHLQESNTDVNVQGVDKIKFKKLSLCHAPLPENHPCSTISKSEIQNELRVCEKDNDVPIDTKCNLINGVAELPHAKQNNGLTANLPTSPAPAGSEARDHVLPTARSTRMCSVPPSESRQMRVMQVVRVGMSCEEYASNRKRFLEMGHAVVDNLVNMILENMGLSPDVAETVDQPSAAASHFIEDNAIDFAIRNRGLRQNVPDIWHTTVTNPAMLSYMDRLLEPCPCEQSVAAEQHPCDYACLSTVNENSEDVSDNKTGSDVDTSDNKTGSGVDTSDNEIDSDDSSQLCSSPLGTQEGGTGDISFPGDHMSDNPLNTPHAQDDIIDLAVTAAIQAQGMSLP